MDMKGRVVVYSITGCPHCKRAKSTLDEMGIPYTDVNLETFPAERQTVRERTGRSTVPQIFFNARHIGGNSDLQKLISDKEEFQRVLEELKSTEPPDDAPQPPDPSTAVEGAISGLTCEPDEYATLAKQLEDSGLIKDRRKDWHLRGHRSVFLGRDFVDWIIKTNKERNRENAMEIGQQLIMRHFVQSVEDLAVFKDDDSFYRLLVDIDSSALNAGSISSCAPVPAAQLGEDIRKLILKIYNAFLSPDGKKVNYKGIAESPEFQTYKELTFMLPRVEIAEATREEKLAFFINIYNAQVVHANVVCGPPTNLWQRYKFFSYQTYIIGGAEYSLQDIENGVLRANRKGVGMFSLPFGKSDPRLKVALQTPEPLIHFALVCGAKSCPPIKTYSADGIDSQLRLAAESFLEGDDSIQIDIPQQIVKLSKIFKWYQEDFGKNKKEVVEFLANLMPEGEKKTRLTEILASGKLSVQYMPYDWSQNS